MVNKLFSSLTIPSSSGMGSDQDTKTFLRAKIDFVEVIQLRGFQNHYEEQMS